MQKISLELKNEKLGLYNRLSMFVVIALAVSYIYISFFTTSATNRFSVFTILAFLFVLILAKAFYKKDIDLFFYQGALFLLAIGWSFQQMYWLAALTLLLQLSFRFAARDKKVSITAEKIIYPAFPARNIQWSELNNVLVKDGLLTIDFKNNKIIQQAIDESKTSVNEQEFNEFCRQLLVINNK